MTAKGRPLQHLRQSAPPIGRFLFTLCGLAPEGQQTSDDLGTEGLCA